MTVPTIDTPRLRLRGHRVEDLSACVAMWSDPIVTRFIGGKPSTEQQTWSRLLNYSGLWAHLGFGYWAIEERKTGAFAGEIGFADFMRDIALSMRGFPELGFALVGALHNQGLATEAVSAVLRWGDANLTPAKTVCLIDPANVASIRVVEKQGYVIFERGTFNGQTTCFLSRDRQGV